MSWLLLLIPCLSQVDDDDGGRGAGFFDNTWAAFGVWEGKLYLCLRIYMKIQGNCILCSRFMSCCSCSLNVKGIAVPKRDCVAEEGDNVTVPVF